MADSRAVESLHPFVLRETKCFLLDLDVPSSSSFPVHGSPTVRNNVGCLIITRFRSNPSSFLTSALPRSGFGLSHISWLTSVAHHPTEDSLTLAKLVRRERLARNRMFCD
jgi:hypothetical protein